MSKTFQHYRHRSSRDLKMTDLVEVPLQPEWIHHVPVFYLHKEEPFRPVSVEHMLRHSYLQKQWEGKTITMPGMPSEQFLTLDMVHNESQCNAKWSDLRSAELNVHKPEELKNYAFWDEAPVYLRVQHESEDGKTVELRCMVCLSGMQERNCFVWSSPRWIHVLCFDLVMKQRRGKWRTRSLTWWDEDGKLVNLRGSSLPKDKQNVTRPALMLSFKQHRLKPFKEDGKYTHLWRPMPQIIPSLETRDSGNTWTKISNFNAFYA